MTFKEYAHTKARELIKSPTKATVAIQGMVFSTVKEKKE